MGFEKYLLFLNKKGATGKYKKQISPKKPDHNFIAGMVSNAKNI
jgi:hypothetical protein